MFYSGLFSSESNNKIWRVKFLFPHKTILLIVRFDDTPPPKQTFFLVGSSLILFLNKTKKRLATRQYAVGGADTCIWHHWKKSERKRKNLIRLGVNQGQAYAWSRTRMGGWAVAQSPILRTTITVTRLKKRGYVSLVEYYQR